MLTPEYNGTNPILSRLTARESAGRSEISHERGVGCVDG